LLIKESLIHYIGNHLGNPIFKYRTKKESHSYSKNIQNCLNWYSNNQRQLEDEIKSGKHMGQLLSYIEETEINLDTKDGPILELGVFRGGTTTCLAKFLMMINSKRKIFACDTFSGFPYGDNVQNKLYGKLKQLSDSKFYVTAYPKTNVDYVNKKYKIFGVKNHIKIINGRFEDTLYHKLDDIKFSFVFSDSDLYKSTLFSLDFLKTRMCSGGIIAFHNYGKSEFGTWGEADAVDEFSQKNKIKLHTEKSIPYFKF